MSTLVCASNIFIFFTLLINRKMAVFNDRAEHLDRQETTIQINDEEVIGNERN